MPRKSIAKNSFYNLLYKGFTALFPLLTTSYISRVLLPDGVGIVAYANTIVNYFVVVAALGIPNYGVKVIASKHSTPRFSAFYWYRNCDHAVGGLLFADRRICSCGSIDSCLFCYNDRSKIDRAKTCGRQHRDQPIFDTVIYVYRLSLDRNAWIDHRYTGRHDHQGTL